MLWIDSAALRWRKIEDEIVVVDLRDATYLTINASGTALWPLLISGTTQAELADALVDRFHVPSARALADVEAFVGALDASNLIVHEDSQAGIEAMIGRPQQLPLLDAEGRPFELAITEEALHLLRRLDRDPAGLVVPSELGVQPHPLQRLQLGAMIKEAIASSQLEDPTTSTHDAEDLIRSGRKPRTGGEQLARNCWHALNFVRERVDEPLTPQLVHELHSIVTEGTPDDTSGADRLDRLRAPAVGDARARAVDKEGHPLHRPPPAEQLPARLEALCDFANASRDGASARLHPMIRAVVLHLWVRHDELFEEGNGPVARALLYWSMVREGYGLADCVSISSVLQADRNDERLAPNRTGAEDLTDAIVYHLRAIVRAVDAFEEELRQWMGEIHEIETLLRELPLNDRQLALLSHALRYPDATYTFRSHAARHGVVYESARSDLLDLQERGLLEKRRVGRTHHFSPVPDLMERIQAA